MSSAGYPGLPNYYFESTTPLTPNLGLALWGMDPIVASNFVVLDSNSGGSKVKVNGTAVTNPNFNGTTPAAPGGFANVTWQFDGSGNVSAYAQATAPGSPATSVQFNNSGVFGGSGELTWDNTNNILSVGSGTTDAFTPLVVDSYTTTFFSLGALTGITVVTQAINNTGGAAVTTGTGVLSTIKAGNGLGSIENSFQTAYSFFAASSCDNVSTIGSLYGLYVQNPVATAGVGEITTYVGVYIEDPSSLSSSGDIVTGASMQCVGPAFFNTNLALEPSTPASSSPLTSAVLQVKAYWWNGTTSENEIWQGIASIDSGTNPQNSYFKWQHITHQVANAYFSIEDTHAATSSVGQNSPLLRLAGNYYNGTTSAMDSWTIQDVLGGGTNGTSTLVVSQLGSIGVANVQVPGLVVTSSFNGATLTQVAQDTMQRADENPMSDGGNWTVVPWSSTHNAGKLASHLYTTTATVTVGAVAWTGSVFSPDQYSTITIQAIGTSAQASPMVRASTSAETAYRVVVTPSSLQVYKDLAGTETTISGSIAYSPVLGDTITLAITGTQLTVYKNGTILPALTCTDSSIASGSPGMLVYTASGTVTISAWSGGNAVAGQLLNGNILMQNTTPAVSFNTNTSPLLTLQGQYWNGSASAVDSWSIQDVIAAGTNGISTLTFTHTGSPASGTSVSIGTSSNNFWATFPITGSLTGYGWTISNFQSSLAGNSLKVSSTNGSTPCRAVMAIGAYNGLMNSSQTFIGSEGGFDALWFGTLQSGNLNIVTNATNRAIVDTGGNWSFINKFVKYNNIALVSNGVPSEYATVDLTAQAAAIAATTLYAVPASGSGMYRISWVASVTTAATSSSTLGGANGLQIVYTDPDDSNSKTTLASVTSSANTTGTCISGCIVVNAKASTNIQYQMGYTSSGATAMQYNLHIKVEAM